MRLRIVSLLSLACASALLVTGCNQSVVTTTSGTPGFTGASYVFAENFNPATQEGTIQSFPLASPGTALNAVAPSSTTVYPGAVTAISCSSCGSGYSTAPAIIVAPPTTAAPYGSTATAVATLNAAGGIATVTITYGGSGYVAAPLVAVGPAPSGAVPPVFSTVTVNTAYVPVTKYSPDEPTVPTFLNTQNYYTQLMQDGSADGKLYFASYPASLPNVVTAHAVTAPNPSVVTGSNGKVSTLTLTAGGAGYPAPPTVTIAPPTAPGGIQATATAILSPSAGPVSSTTITASGANYSSAPTVTFAPPTTVGGVTATGTANIAGGVVTSITLTNAGSGYVTAPAVTLAGGGFTTPATASAAVAAPYGVVTGLTITNPGSGYNTTTPSVSIAPPPSASATAVINGSGVVTAINVDNGGIGYPASPAPTVTLSAPNSAAASATATINAAGQVTALTVTNPGFGYTSVPTVTIAPQFQVPPQGTGVNPAPTVTAAPSAVATINGSGVVNGVTITSVGGEYVTPPTVTFSAPGQAYATAAVSVYNPGSVTPAVAPNGGNVTSVTIGYGGAGYTTPPAVTFSSPNTGGTTATGTATISGGVVTGITITNPGQFYSPDPPVITIDPPPASIGTTAVGTPVMTVADGLVTDGGVVTGINVTNLGSGYLAPPQISFTPTPPTVPVAATATAVITNGQLTGFTNLTPGSGYTSTPTVTIPAASGTTAATAGTVTINGSGTITNIAVASGGNGYITAPSVTIAGNGIAQATATATAVGPVSIGALNIGKVLTDVLQSNFKSMTVDTAGTIYISEANGHMVLAPSNASAGSNGVVLLTGTGTVNPVGALVDYDLTTDAAGTGASAINPTGVGASNTGFDLMTVDLTKNLYTYVAGSGVITEYTYNPIFNFAPYVGTATCPIGTSQCLIGNTAVTATFPTANRTITLPSSVTNVVDFVNDIFGNLYVLSQNGGAGLATVTEYAPCSASCTPTPIRTIGGANTGFNIPGSLALDTIGNIYVEDFSVASPTLNTFSIFTVNQSGNVAPSLSFTETVPNTLPAPSTGTPSTTVWQFTNQLIPVVDGPCLLEAWAVLF